MIVWSGHSCPLLSAALQNQKASTLIRSGLLRCFYFVPNFVVLRASCHVLPEIDMFLVVIYIVQMQTLHFVRRHELRGMRIRWHVSSHICNFLLSLSRDHELKKFCREFFVLATSGDHQMI